MKRIKQTFTAISVGLILLANQSCVKDFLEQPNDAIINVDSVFADPDRAMTALWGVYAAANARTLCGGLNYDASSNPGLRGMGWAGAGMMWTFSDEGFYPRSSALPRYMINGTWGPDQNNFREFYVEGVTSSMRTSLIFIENAEKVPYEVTPTWNWDENLKKQAIAEAKFWLAFWHFETAKRFGGIPIMDKVPTYTQTATGLVISPAGTRRSLRTTYDFILKLCDEVIPNLPDSYPDTYRGRVTKGAALGLKAKVLLFAASDWYNTPPTLSYGDERDTLISFTTVDPDRWVKARDAAKASIDWAEANGYVLLDDPSISKTLSYIIGSTCGKSLSPLNKEVILQRAEAAGSPGGVHFYQGSAGFNNYNTHPASPGVAFVRNNFRTIDGADVNIPDNGTFPALKTTLKKMEPRFHSIVHVPGYYYSEYNNSQAVTWAGRDSTLFWYYKTDGSLTYAKTSNPTSYFGPYQGFFFVKKWHTMGTGSTQSVNIVFPLFRLAEFYLNYAEAANEANPNDADIITYLNKIRVRGGLPLLAAGQATYDAKFGNKDLMRAEIQRERAIELYGEEHRYFDLRRWKKTELNGGDWPTIQLYENGTGAYANPTGTWTAAQRATNNAKLSYRIVVSTVAPAFTPRVWTSKMIFYPWQRSEVSKGFIIQNPGWE